MKRYTMIAVALLVLSTQAEARRCINGKVMAPNGQCVTPEVLASMPKPPPAKPDPYANYRSCPLEMKWNGAGCEPVVMCPYSMKRVGDHCETPMRR